MPDVTPDDLHDRGWRRLPHLYVKQWIHPDGERIAPEAEALAELARERGDIPASKAKGKAT
jgi:hypothetical protein